MRVGLAGYAVGRAIHSPLILEAGGELAAIATANPDRIEQARADHPDAAIVPNLDALLARDDLDAVVLTTPTGAHHAHCLQLIGRGLPFVCDKPLSTNADLVGEIVAAAAAAGVPFSVFHNRRWDPSHRTARQLLAQGRLSPVWRYEFRWERWRPVPKHRWREDAPPQLGGGTLLDLGPHLIDSAIDLFGPIESVRAELECRLSPSEDDVFLDCRHGGGVVSHLWASSISAAPGPRIRILSGQGAYVFDDFDPDLRVHSELDDAPGRCGWWYSSEERIAVPEAPGTPADYYREFFAAIRGEGEVPVPPESALAVARVIDAARISARDGGQVCVPAV